MKQNQEIEFEFSEKLSPEEVLAEIATNLSKENPDIEITNSVILKHGPRAYKFAIIYKIISRNTGKYKHHALHVKTYQKRKDGWLEKPDSSIILENKEEEEIERLSLFLNAFYAENLPNQNGEYGIVKREHFDLLKTLLDSENGIVQEVLENPEAYQKLLNTGGIGLLNDVINISLNDNDSEAVSSKLKELNIDKLSELNSIAGLTQLKSFEDIWLANEDNDDEEFWQQILTQYSWVISQVFSMPVFLFAGKAYVGGKWIDNRGGNIADFLFANSLTKNSVLVEIKTPKAKLIGQKYRQTYSTSGELSGSINQILNYKTKLQREYSNIIANNPDKPRFEAFNPRCLLILGHYEQEINEHLKKEALENHRANSREIDIITFDELYQKIKMLMNLLEGK
jgi:hypothetical protein